MAGMMVQLVVVMESGDSDNFSGDITTKMVGVLMKAGGKVGEGVKAGGW